MQVEVHLSPGLPGLAIVGLPEAAVREARERIRSALINTRFDWPARRVTINLAPADLPMALGVLAASGQFKPSVPLDESSFWANSRGPARCAPCAACFRRRSPPAATGARSWCPTPTRRTCPCGYLGDPDGRCRCTPDQIARYRRRISGPILDRIDLHVEVPRPPPASLAPDRPADGEPSTAVAARVARPASASWRGAGAATRR